MNPYSRSGLALFAITLGFAYPANGQGRAQEAVDDLLRDFPDTSVLWTNEEDRRARSIFGVPMTRGETVREATERFLLSYGEALTGGEADFEQTQAFERLDGSTVLHFQQFVDGVTVDGSIVRLLVRDDDDSGPAVVYASGHFARPPALGLPEPVIPAAAAVAAARLHPAGLELEEWAEPELVATTESGTLSRGEAQLAWKVRGWTDLAATHAFWVNAATGAVIREADLTVHYRDPTPSVSGTVTGGATPGTEPDKGVGHRCGANLPQVVALPELIVEITNAAETVVLDSATTSSDGDYEFFGTSYPSDAKIRFTWDSIGRDLQDHVTVSPTSCTILPIPPHVINLGTTFPVTHDHNFNPSTFTEFDTSKVNIHLHLVKARDFVLSRLPTSQYPALYSNVLVIANHCGDACNAFYRELGPEEFPYITYGRKEAPGCDFNIGYSTIIPHEYGHYLLAKMLDISPYDTVHQPFHEGFADTLGMFVQDVDIYGENWLANCDPARDPLGASPAAAFDCEYDTAHEGGMLLSALWLELATSPCTPSPCGGIGPSDAKQLFVDWMLLTAGGIEDGPTGCEDDAKAAGPATLIEVLIADDDDSALNNGTPNSDVICAIFADRLITAGGSPCGSPLHGGSCSVDTDDNGALDAFDYMTFLNWFSSLDPRADWDGDDQFTSLDMLLFEQDFGRGC